MRTQDPMTQEQLDAIQGRVDGATRGPWGCYGDGAHEVFDAGEYSDGDRGEVVAAVIDKLSDAVFIAHAREDVPALLAEVERLRADNARLRSLTAEHETDLLDTRAGLALANTARKEGAAAMDQAHRDIEKDRARGVPYPIFYKPGSPYSAPLLRRIAEDKEEA